MIKLRAWDEEKKKYYQNIWGHGIECEINEDNELSLIITDIDKVAIVQDERPLQPLLFAGRKDKNEQEIYDGHILTGIKLNGHDFGNCEVCFDEGSFYLKHKDGYLLFAVTWGCPTMEVIGNKFEHPELLESKP